MRKGIIYVYFNRAKYEKEGIEKYYVGQTMKTIEQRAGKDGRGYGTFNETCNTKFANSIRKWGWNSFEYRILEEAYEEDLDELEKFYIEYFDSFKNGYNSTLGGEGAKGHNPYANKTEEEIEKIKEKIRISNKKHFQNPKARENRSETAKKLWEDKEYKEKQSISQKKRWEDEERRKKIMGELNPCAKGVYCEELSIVFSYTKLAEKYCVNVLNIKIGKIRNVCNGKLISSGRYNGTKLTWNWTKNLDKETLNNAEYIDDKCYEEIINGNKKYLENPEIKKIQNKRLLCEKNGNTKKVYCDTLNIIFSYIGLAEKYCIDILNSKASKIGLVCNGKAKYSGKLSDGTKLTWSWTKNLDKETLNNAEYIDSKCYEEIINGNKKYLKNPEIKKMQNKRLLCEKNGHAKSVYCNTLNIVFSYIGLAEEYCINVLNSKIGPIRAVCNGKRKSTGAYNGKKLTWNWIENVDKETLDNAEYIDSKKYEEIINAKINN